MRRSLLAITLLLGVATSGCTTQTVEPVTVPAIEGERYTAIAIGTIDAAKPEMAHLVPFFRAALIEQLRKEVGVETVLDPAPAQTAAGQALLSGQLTELDLGSAAARFIIGFGAGAQRLKGRFTLTSPMGRPLAEFASHETYSGGAGIGGLSVIGLEEFAQIYGTSTGVAVGRWLRGEKL